METADELSPAVGRLSGPVPHPGSATQVESALADRLARVVESAVDVMGVDAVGLMLLDQDDALRAAGYTSAPASALEHVQVELGEGPGIDASTRAETVAVADLAEAVGYVGLWRRIADSGVRAVLASPVWLWGTVIGNLNAVRNEAHRWTETEIRANEAFAKVVGVTLDLAVQTLDSARGSRPSTPGPHPGPVDGPGSRPDGRR